jgi:hypothetical protein
MEGRQFKNLLRLGVFIFVLGNMFGFMIFIFLSVPLIFLVGINVFVKMSDEGETRGFLECARESLKEIGEIFLGSPESDEDEEEKTVNTRPHRMDRPAEPRRAPYSNPASPPTAIYGVLEVAPESEPEAQASPPPLPVPPLAEAPKPSSESRAERLERIQERPKRQERQNVRPERPSKQKDSHQSQAKEVDRGLSYDEWRKKKSSFWR